ncbi:glycosyltransferase [Ectobacillus polymachus]|uniref:glycosyltransferase n=1 Tax=Ectobacillus polymachus TaxID=1508806 RepID=UPI003A8991C8
MRVLHIINHLGSGGAEKLIEESLPRMRNKTGIEVETLLLNDEENVFGKNLKENGIKVTVVPLKKIYSPLNIFFIRKHIIKGNYDIVHVHLFPSQLWAALAVKLILKNKPKLITTEHNTHNRRREKKYYRFFDKVMYLSFDKIISISEKTQENLTTWLGIKSHKTSKFQVIENGINTKKFIYANPYKKTEISKNFTENTKIISMVGRFTAQKDQKTLIKAMTKLPENMHLLLVGEGQLQKRVQEFSNEMGLENRVHFLGFRSDIEKILKSSDIVVLSSHWEGFGLAAVEGMAAGKPVIASNVSGLRDVVSGGGVLFTRGDYIGLAKEISVLIQDQDKYYKVADSCQDKAKNYDIDRMVDKYLEVYRYIKP